VFIVFYLLIYESRKVNGLASSDCSWSSSIAPLNGFNKVAFSLFGIEVHFVIDPLVWSSYVKLVVLVIAILFSKHSL
jgi:hypothetical protein